MLKRFVLLSACVALLATSWSSLVMAQEAREITLEDSRKLFASTCSWCHGSFGMKAGKGGPKLAGTTKDEEGVYNTIVKGQGAMPSFKKQLGENEIRALARYIKSLPSDEPAAQ